MTKELASWPIHKDDNLSYCLNEKQPMLSDGTTWAELDLEFISSRPLRDRKTIGELDFLCCLANLYSAYKVEIKDFLISVRYPGSVLYSVPTSVTHYKVQYTLIPKELA